MFRDSNNHYENACELHQRLVRHLSDDSQISQVSKHFSGLVSNLQRVNFAGELLKSASIAATFSEDDKNDVIAIEMRQKGNDMFKIKKLKDAWEFYTKSVALAETAGVLALAFANRSAVLFELNLHQQCLTDIDRALENDYPDDLKSKLLVRRKNAKNLEAEPSPAHEIVPEIANKSSKISSASDCVEIVESGNQGRYVVAKRDIQVGEIIAIENPFAVLLVNQLYNHCHECILLCYNLIPCSYCTQALYCSDTCKNRAFESYHKYECRILLTAKNLELDKLKMLPLKIAFMAKDQYQEIANGNGNIKLDNEVYSSERYSEIHNLVTNTEKRAVADLFKRAVYASLIYEVVKGNTIFFDDADEEVFKEVLLLHMQTGPSNFHEVTELAPNGDGVFEPEEVASGSFSFLSLFNHSCCPNVTRFCHGTSIVMRAIESIKEGEQCFDNYGYHYAIMSKSDRQKHLKDQYHFDCTCKACEESWPTYDDLPFLKDLPEVDAEVACKLSSADVESAKTSLEDCLLKLKSLEELKPCKNFCQTQEAVKQCFAVLGNKRNIL